MVFVDNRSGLGFRDRLKVNTEILADQMGMRMNNVNLIQNELGPNVRRDIPDQVMPSDLIGPENMQQQQMMDQQIALQQMMPQQMSQMSQMPMQVPHANPFMESSFNNSNMPDLPINTPPTVIGQLLNDDEVPEKIRDKYWYVFHKDNSLSFLDEDRKRSKLMNMDIIKIDILNSTPYYDYTFDKELEFDVVRNIFETKLDRSLGYGSKGGNPKNERILLQSQFTEQRHINDMGTSENQIKNGFIRRLLGRR